MQIDIRLPEHFNEHDGCVISNFDHLIDTVVADEIKGMDIYSQYAGWNFCGYVWWSTEHDKWACEVWTYNVYQETILADTLEEIRTEVCEKYGYE